MVLDFDKKKEPNIFQLNMDPKSWFVAGDSVPVTDKISGYSTDQNVITEKSFEELAHLNI